MLKSIDLKERIDLRGVYFGFVLSKFVGLVVLFYVGYLVMGFKVERLERVERIWFERLYRIG